MAGDWIKMREALFEDPAVLQMAAQLETRPEHIVGYCHRFWGWASRNMYVDDVTENCDECHVASVTGVTLTSVETVLHLPGFLSLLCDVGWLMYDDTGEEPVIVVPKFDRHLSEGAKGRVLTAERQRKSRAKKASHKPVTREEKRREEKRVKKPLVVPLDEIDYPEGMDTKSVRTAIVTWLDYKRGRRQPYKQPAQQIGLLLKEECFGGDPAIFVAAVAHSIARNYQGCFPPKEDSHGTTQGTVAESGRIRGADWSKLPTRRSGDNAADGAVASGGDATISEGDGAG